MYAFKIVTTTLDIIIMSIIFFFMRGAFSNKDKYTMVGFSFVQILYLMNICGIWWC